MELEGVGERHDMIDMVVDPGLLERSIRRCTCQRTDNRTTYLAQGIDRQALRWASLRSLLPLVGTLVVALLERRELTGSGVGGEGEGAAAIGADDLAGEARGASPPHRSRLAPALAFGFHLLVQLFVDDHRVGPLHLEPGKLAAVHLLAMGDVVVHEGPLQDAEPAVFFLIEKPHYRGFTEWESFPIEDSLFCQGIGYLGEHHPVGESAVHEPYRLGFLLDYLEMVLGPPVAVDGVGKEASLGEPFADTPFDVLAYRIAFFLSIGSEDREHQFPVRRKGVQVLPLEADRYVAFPQVPHGLQQIDGVACEAADGFGEDDIDLSFLAIGDKPPELAAVFHPRTGYPGIRIHPRILPRRVSLDNRAVVADLGCQRVHQFVRVDRDACIGGHPPFRGKGSDAAIDLGYLWHGPESPPVGLSFVEKRLISFPYK